MVNGNQSRVRGEREGGEHRVEQHPAATELHPSEGIGGERREQNGQHRRNRTLDERVQEPLPNACCDVTGTEQERRVVLQRWRWRQVVRRLGARLHIGLQADVHRPVDGNNRPQDDEGDTDPAQPRAFSGHQYSTDL